MLYNERKIKILELFRENTTLKVVDISEELGVSVDTVRRDLKRMESEDLVKYIFGGAILNEETIQPRQYGNFSSREIQNKELKHQLAKKAIAEIKQNDVIFINSGTTGTILAEEIAHVCEEVTVITNNLEAANMFLAIGNPTIKVVCLGGSLDITEKSVYGYQCEQELRSYYPDVCFLSMNAINVEQGYMDFRTNEIGVMRIASENSRRVVAIMDSTKFGSRSQKQVFKSSEIDAVYADASISDDTIVEYEENGIIVL